MYLRFACMTLSALLALFVDLSFASPDPPPGRGREGSSYLGYLSPSHQRLHAAIEGARSAARRARVIGTVDSLLLEAERGTVEHADLLDLKTLALLKSQVANPDSVLPIALRAMGLRERLPRDDARLATTSFALGGALTVAGDDLGGLLLLRQSLEMRLATPGVDPRAIAMSWHGLGNVFCLAGSRAAGLRAYETAVLTLERAGYGDSWNALLARWSAALVQLQLGRTQSARLTLETVREELLRFVAAPDVLLATADWELAEARYVAGDSDGLMDLLQSAFDTFEQIESPSPMSEALARGLATAVAARQGDLRSARHHAAEARVVAVRAGIPSERVAVYSALELAVEILEADTIADLEEVASVAAHVGSLETSATVRSWMETVLAVAAWKASDPAVAVERSLVAHGLLRAEVRSGIQMLRRSEARVSTARRNLPLSVALSAVVEAESIMSGSIARVWTAAADSRATATDLLRIRAKRAAIDPSIGTAKRIQIARTELDKRRLSGRESEPEVQRLEREVARLEHELILSTTDLERWVPASVDSSRVSLAHVQDALGELPDDVALVGFVSFDRAIRGLNSSPFAESRASLASDHPTLIHPCYVVPSYAAFVRRVPGGSLHFIDLGPAKVVDDAIEAWRHSVASADPLEGRERTGDHHEVSRTLRRLLWDPVASAFGDPRLVLIIPDGPIHFVGFDGLEEDDGRFVAESAPLIHSVSSERALLRIQERPHGTGASSALLVAGPTFVGPVSAMDRGANPRRTGPVDKSYTGDEVQRSEFHPLPGALLEGVQLARLLSSNEAHQIPVTLLSGRTATESRTLIEAPRHSILHFATHAFFRPDASEFGVEATSGIALAHVTPDASDPSNDGLLFADEILQLDLNRADWVVLSACETGLGDVDVGEGVRGLRDAFETAGARTLIMSLWKVHDQPTREWMLQLYRARLEGASTAEAMRHANLEILRRRRERGDDDDPLYWASFVAAGDWR